jgi:predicted kinase
VTTRAKGPALFAVPTRAGEFRTWRALTPAESAVAFDRIAEEKTAAVDRMTRAIEAEQRQHRAAFVARSAGLNVAQLSELTVDWTERYRVAMLPALRSLSEFAQTDALQEIAAQIGTPNWTAQSQTPPTGAAQQVEAAARLAAKSVNDRTNERLRGAAIQVANGARPSTLTAAPVSIGTTAGGLLEQTASTTVNETRAVTAAEQGPEIEWATYSAVMDRWTCPECEKADGRRVRYGTDEYRRLSPPNPRCRSVVNSQGAQNLCQCVWVYEFKKPDVTPGPTNTTPGGGLVFRSAPSPAAVRVVLVCGPPGSGKSTWAAAQPGVVVDRDGFVLTEAGYNPDGRAESLAALTEAVQAAAPGGVVHFVACMLTPAARKRVADHVQATADRAVAIEVVAIDRPREVLHAVNAEREGTERGSIPADQLEHILDAWQAPTPDEVNALAGADV